jgi:predicted Zn-dependent protease
MSTQPIVLSLKMALLVSSSLLFNQCSRNPVTGKRQLSFMSESQEKSLGVSADPQIQTEYGVYADEKLQQYINEKGQEMAKISHRPNLGYQFKVMDSPIVNAFAVPGGYVYFTRGIMAHFNNEAQFMGVLGHEIGHITARHGASQQTKQILGQVGLIAAMIASPKVAQFGNELSQGLGLLFLKFGRDDERQSDKLGVEYSSKVNYDAKEMAGFFSTLARLSGDEGQRLPEFLSTHPDPGNRYTSVLAMATETQTKAPSNYSVNRESYLRLIDGMIYGDDPKQGYIENNVFYHPELKFEFPIPAQWKTQNSPSQFAMAAPDQKGMMILTLGQGDNLNAASDNFVQQYKLRRVEARNVTIGGFPAIEQLCEQVPQQQQGGGQQQQAQPSVTVKNVMVQYNNLIYSFIGACETPDFQRYDPTFSSVMFGFRQLNDPSKINVLPERVQIKTVANSTSFQEAMRSFGMPEARWKELSILNGMQLTDAVSAGTLVKVVGK